MEGQSGSATAAKDGQVNITYRERLPRQDRRLGRHVNHDYRSRAFAYQAPAKLDLQDVEHQRHIPIFNQGDLGKCVPSSGLGMLGTGQYYAAYQDLGFRPYDLTDSGATQAYRDVTHADPFPGEWEPEDTGSDGLSMAKLLKTKAVISGYLHIFTMDAFLAALQKGPVSVGTWWRRDMFTPSAEGLITPGGVYDGGHQYTAVQYLKARGWVGFDQSWGRWGLRGTGRFYMEAEKFGSLLAEDGDGIVYTLPTAPAPEPQPLPGDEAVSAADRLLWEQHGGWAEGWGLFTNTIRRDFRAWGETKKFR